MAEEFEESKPQESEIQNPSPNPKSSSMSLPSLSLNIWPPSQRTRDAVTQRLVDTLSSPTSVLAKRYGTLPREDALSIAADIEKQAFADAESAADDGRSSSIDGGLEILEIYSKAISRKMLESVKARAPDSTSNSNPVPPSMENLSIGDAESRAEDAADTEAPDAA